MADGVCYVYWVHLPEHTDMFSSGYIGVTTRTPQVRYEEHLQQSEKGSSPIHFAIRKHRDDLIISTVCICNEQYAYYLEEKLRPEKRIGWNLQKGGFAPPSTKGKKRVPRVRVKGTPAHREAVSRQMKEWWAARTQDERKELTKHFENNRATREQLQHHWESRRGKSLPEETIAKMSIAQKKYAEDNMDDKIATAALMRKTAERTPWLISDARVDVWYCADELYKLRVQHPTESRSEIIARHGIFVKNDIVALYKRLENGWNPSEDELWREWQSSTDVQVVPTRGRKVCVKGCMSSRANVDVWLLANEVFNYLSSNPRAGLKRISKNFLPHGPDAFESMLDKFKNGWVPSEDDNWIEWVNKQRSENEP